MEPRRPGKAELLIALLSTAAMVWCMIPEHQRQLLVMRSLNGARQLAARAARAQGRAGMGDELGGYQGTARQHYGAAVTLGQLRDELARRLDRMRP
jgi:hypothetical protein